LIARGTAEDGAVEDPNAQLPSFPDGVGERVISTRERRSFGSVLTVEVLSAFASVFAEEALPACWVVLNMAIATRYGGA
jgi:hypothetical protein